MTHRRFTGDRLVVASHNAGKAREIRELLQQFPIEVISAAALNLPEPDETEMTFIGNAELKARAAATASGIVALADDSGMSVDALNGDPGIYSARWAGPDKDFNFAMKRVEAELGDNPNRRAQFNCALSLCWPDGHCESFIGVLQGQLVFPPRGVNGFGYDPIFIPDGHTLTCGEMTPALKQEISQRAMAFRQLVDACFR